MRTVLLSGVLMVLGVGCLGSAAHAQGVIIDYDSIVALDSLPDARLADAASLSYFFAHASVGGDMIKGIGLLNVSNSVRYPLVKSWSSGAVPTSVAAGKIYDYDRGNPGWHEKYDEFEASMDSGWGNNVDVALSKLCYIDKEAELQPYLDSMTALEATYPDTIFIYMTIPLTVSADDSNVLRGEYNKALRSWVAANDRVLFDVADIEAHYVDGSGDTLESTFTSGGETYQTMHSAYTYDGGHLNDVGRELVGKGFYALGVELTPEPASLSLLAAGAVCLLRRRRRSG